MGENKQERQEMAAAEEITGKKKSRYKFTIGKLLALVFGVVVIVYMAFSVQLFYNFIRIMITDPDAAKQQGTAAEALDEMYMDEEE